MNITSELCVMPHTSTQPLSLSPSDSTHLIVCCAAKAQVCVAASCMCAILQSKRSPSAQTNSKQRRPRVFYVMILAFGAPNCAQVTRIINNYLIRLAAIMRERARTGR
jgi:hypothetical protein